VNLKERAAKFKTDVPAVFLALRSRETPFPVKVLTGVTVAYILSPIDLIPDFIPVLGLLDYLIILPGLVALVVKLIPKEVFAECREEANDLWSNGKPKRWYYAIPIVLIWALAMFLIIKAIWLR
jgi:uncharacterized membrane protein YkvA (DUF1232 family)